MARTVVCLAMVSGLFVASAAAQDAGRGAKVYAEQKCGVCHSIGGTGNKNGPLDSVGSKISADEIRAWIVDAKGMTAKTKAARKPEMRTYSLPKEDVEALVVYLSAMKAK